MPRFLESALTRMRRCPVTTYLLGIGLGVCFVLLVMNRGGSQPESIWKLSFGRPPADRHITETSKPTTFSTDRSNIETIVAEAAITETANVEKTNVETAHVETANVETAKVETANVETANVEKTNVEKANVDKAIVETAIAGSHIIGSNRTKLSYPDWWLKAWSNSATYGKNDVFVDDKPLIHTPCVSTKKSGKTFKFLEPIQYLPNSKNPCWWRDPKQKTGLRCVPYFYLAGVAKGGTTDLFGRVTKHPDVLRGSQKEYHWWERLRYLDPPDRMSFKDYVDQITGNRIKEVEEELRTKGSTVKLFSDFSPSYFFHPSHWPELEGNQGCHEPRYIITQHIRHFHRDAKILLTFRHPTTRLYSRFLSRVPRTSFFEGNGPEDFHRHVLEAIKAYRNCFARWSIRHCVYNGTLFNQVKTRLMEGMYPAFMADWVRVWPRSQMHIMRYEDYGGHEEERIAEIFDFLGLAPLNQTEMDKIAAKQVSNSGVERYHIIGSMLPETKEILDKFYQPFINQFAEILNDKRFLWLDTKH